jgi:hypothetical protein
LWWSASFLAKFGSGQGNWSEIVRFKYPRAEGDFDIPDNWWDEAGMWNFVPSAPTFSCDLSCSSSPIATIRISAIAVPRRNPGVAQFEHDRMINILSGIRGGAVLPPVEVVDRPEDDSLMLRHGFHRFHASIATGLTYIPAVFFPFWEPEVPSIKMP